MTNYYIKIKNSLDEISIYSTQAMTDEDARIKAVRAYKFRGNTAKITDLIIRKV